MKLLFRILKSSFTDKLAYISAVAGALCWLVHAWYPAILPGQLRATAHIYMTILASLAAGIMIAKYVLMEGYLRSVKDLITEKEAFAVTIQKLEVAMQEIREDRDRTWERESVLKNKLKSFENSETEAQFSSLRKKIRLDDEDRKTCLAFLVRELRNRLQELDHVDDQDIARAAAVLKKETQMVEDEIKKGTVSLYELVLKISEIREYIHDLAIIRLQSGDGQEESGDERQAEVEVGRFELQALHSIGKDSWQVHARLSVFNLEKRIQMLRPPHCFGGLAFASYSLALLPCHLSYRHRTDL